MFNVFFTEWRVVSIAIHAAQSSDPFSEFQHDLTALVVWSMWSMVKGDVVGEEFAWGAKSFEHSLDKQIFTL